MSKNVIRASGVILKDAVKKPETGAVFHYGDSPKTPKFDVGRNCERIEYDPASLLVTIYGKGGSATSTSVTNLVELIHLVEAKSA